MFTNVLGEEKVPNSAKCPLSGNLFQDPVIASDGHSYEKSNFENYLLDHKGEATKPSPVTGEPLQRLGNSYYFPNIALKNSLRQTYPKTYAEASIITNQEYKYKR